MNQLGYEMSDLWGLSEKGFKAKDLHMIKSDIEAALKKEVDLHLQFHEGTVSGMLVSIVASQARQVWESLSSLYHALQADTASGRSLDALCSLTGTYRAVGEYSEAKARVLLRPGTNLPADSTVKTTNGHTFKLLKEVSNESQNEAEIETILVAQEKGPIRAHMMTEGQIMKPVSGWVKTTFIETHKMGRFDETDNELRLKRIQGLKSNGSSTPDALGSRLQKIKGVEAFHIKEADHSFNVIIKGGDDNEIAQAIWQSKPIGVQTDGKITVELKDFLGQLCPVKFSRPETISIYLKANLKIVKLKDEEVSTFKGALKNSLADFAANHFKMGSEIYAARFYAPILSNPLVLDVMTLSFSGNKGSPLPKTIPPEQIASLSPDDISIECIMEGA